MGERGLDISEWQAGMDVERVCRENNISFVYVRSNYGSAHDDLQFHEHCDGAERGGAIVTPYVYPLATDTRGSIDDAVRIAGERYKRIAVDWEQGSGGGDQLRIAHERCWEHGLDTRTVYDPAWYAAQQGNPDQSWMGRSGRIKARWKSWYPDNVPGSFDQILAKIPNSVYNDSRGGIPTRIVQFTSSGRLSGWDGNLDLNYFPGSRAELVALLIGETEDMTPEEHEWLRQINVVVGHAYEKLPDGTEVDLGTRVKGLDQAVGSAYDASSNTDLGKRTKKVENDVTEIKSAITKLTVSGVPVSVELNEEQRDDIAERVANKLAVRMAE